MDHYNLLDPATKGGVMILECISPHFQIHRSFSMPTMFGGSRSLHAAAWQDVALLEIAAARLSQSSFIWQRAIPRNWSVWWTRGKGFQQPLRSPCDEPI
jgi:hypothetical protein